MAQVKAMVAILNSCGEIPLESEVVIAVPSLHLLSTKSMIRADIAIAAEVKNAPLIIHKVHQPISTTSTVDNSSSRLNKRRMLHLTPVTVLTRVKLLPHS